MKLYIADAFTETLFGGNPAGVVLLENGKDFPPDEIMKKTAAELRYSETAFIKRLDRDEFQIRYFTPAAEVDLCGHATIASFACLMDAGLIKSGQCYTNHTLAGQLQIEIEDGLVMMDMAPPKHIATIDNAPALRELYEVMGLSYAPCETASTSNQTINLFPMIISAGLADIIMPVSSRAALSAIAPDFKQLSALSQKYSVVGVHAFTLESSIPGITAHCRNFAPLYGIDEEAATGTSSGALAYYLYKNELLKNSTVSFIQGEAMGRASKILASIKSTAHGEITGDDFADSITTADAPGICTQTGKNDADICKPREAGEKRRDASEIRIQTGGRAAILARGEIML